MNQNPTSDTEFITMELLWADPIDEDDYYSYDDDEEYIEKKRRKIVFRDSARGGGISLFNAAAL